MDHQKEANSEYFLLFTLKSRTQSGWHRPASQPEGGAVRARAPQHDLELRSKNAGASSMKEAGRKPPKMFGLNTVVSLGMDLLGTSKKMFFFL
jgi:hypothetical protein